MQLDLRGLTDATDETAARMGVFIFEKLSKFTDDPSLSHEMVKRYAGMACNFWEIYQIEGCPTSQTFYYYLGKLQGMALVDGVEILTGD